MKIKVSIQVETSESVILKREIEVELTEETINEIAQEIYAAQLRLQADAESAAQETSIQSEQSV